MSNSCEGCVTSIEYATGLLTALGFYINSVTGYRKSTEARVVLPSIPTAVLVSLDTENEPTYV